LPRVRQAISLPSSRRTRYWRPNAAIICPDSNPSVKLRWLPRSLFVVLLARPSVLTRCRLVSPSNWNRVRASNP